MVANVSYNPNLTTVTEGLFNTTSVGLVQGTAYPDPSTRFKLAAGTLALTETLPMWGGVGIFTDVPGVSGGPSVPLGTVVGRATSIATLVAFSVFDQAYGMINTPQSPVPLAGSSMQVMYYRLGSGARIAVAAAAVLASLEGGLTTAAVSWDFVNQQLIPYVATYIAATAASATYNTTTGIIALTFSPAPVGTLPTNGIYLSLSGLTASGGAGAANVGQLAGDFALASSSSSGVILNLQGPVGLGAITLNTGVGTIAAGGGALPCQVLDVQVTNCQVVSYSAATGFATWNFNGVCALILI